MTDRKLSDLDKKLFHTLGITGERDMNGLETVEYDNLIAAGLVKIDRKGFACLTLAGQHAFDHDQPSEASHEPIEHLKAADRKQRKSPPMKETTEDKKISDQTYAFTAAELRQFIERLEQKAAEKADLAADEKEIFSEAKGRGFNTKVIRKVIAIRKRKPAEVAEEDAVLDLYKSALGMI